MAQTSLVGATYHHKYDVRVTTAPDPDLGIVDALAQLSFLVQNTLARTADADDLSLVQTRLLGVLRDREPGMRELAALLDLDKSSVTGLVDRAERRGLVQRVPSREDRRMAHVRLTTAGRDVVDRVTAAFGREVEDIVAPLGRDDRDVLRTLATRVLAARAETTGVELVPTAPRP